MEESSWLGLVVSTYPEDQGGCKLLEMLCERAVFIFECEMCYNSRVVILEVRASQVEDSPCHPQRFLNVAMAS